MNLYRKGCFFYYIFTLNEIFVIYYIPQQKGKSIIELNKFWNIVEQANLQQRWNYIEKINNFLKEYY